jgi:hypothetical protein
MTEREATMPAAEALQAKHFDIGVFHTMHNDRERIEYMQQTAEVLASQGLNVLVVDMNVESPGLNDPFEVPIEKPGFIDFVTRFFDYDQDLAKSGRSVEYSFDSDPGTDSKRKSLISGLIHEVNPPRKDNGSISILPAGYFGVADENLRFVLRGNLELLSVLESDMDDDENDNAEVNKLNAFAHAFWRSLLENIDSLSSVPDVLLVSAPSGVGTLSGTIVQKLVAEQNGSLISIINSMRPAETAAVEILEKEFGDIHAMRVDLSGNQSIASFIYPTTH